MLVCAVLCAVEAIKQIGDPIFARMVISLASTYGVFIVSSILALDPWHLITCFAQYILFSPSESRTPGNWVELTMTAYVNVVSEELS